MYQVGEGAMHHQIHVIFKGNVQGVGFRYTARDIAHRHSVVGYVKNLTSGDVEVVAEGNQAQVAQFMDEIDREMQGYINSRVIESKPPSGEFLSFTVRF
jgi:acylphosphatase